MIRWNEQKPDTIAENVATLTAHLSVVDAALLLLSSQRSPVVICNPSCRDAIFKHLRTAQVELGGLLLGRVFTNDSTEGDPDATVVYVSAAIAATSFDSTGASLRMASDVWEKARSALTHRPGVVVGWYHSHPNLGAFFSGTDRRTQARFFSQPSHLGLVVDPFRNEERWYIGPNSEEVTKPQVVSLDLETECGFETSRSL